MSDKSKEKWQIYRANGEPIMNGGITANEWNKASHELQFCSIVRVWLYRRTTTGVEILFQHRAHGVDHFPDQWDVSAGGHINYEETRIEAAIRESKEEIGVEINSDELFYGFTTIGEGSTTIKHTFFCDWTNRDPVFSFNDHEVQAVQWIAFSRIDTFRKQFVKASLAQDNNYFTLLKTWLAENASVDRAVIRRTLH